VRHGQAGGKARQLLAGLAALICAAMLALGGTAGTAGADTTTYFCCWIVCTQTAQPVCTPEPEPIDSDYPVPSTPEAPNVLLLPLAAGAAGTSVWLVRRRRASSAT
jgi:hypothetical protein